MWIVVEIVVEDGEEGTKMTEVTPEYMDSIWPCIVELQQNGGYLDSDMCNFLDKILPRPKSGDLYKVIDIKLFRDEPMSLFM